MKENISKIKYLSVTNTKIYKVTDIDFCNPAIEADGTNLSIADVLESEVFPVEEWKAEQRIIVTQNNRAAYGTKVRKLKIKAKQGILLQKSLVGVLVTKVLGKITV